MVTTSSTVKTLPKRADVGHLPCCKNYKHPLFGQQENLYIGCGIFFPLQNLTINHILSQSKVGTNHLDILQHLCNACNNVKVTGTQAELIV